MTIKERVLKEISSENRLKHFKDNRRIKDKYQEMDSQNKLMVDDIFISLCGYSLGFIINETVEEENDDN